MHVRARAAAGILLAAATFLSGCGGVFTAHVPESLLTDGWHEDKQARSEESQFLGLGLNRVSLVYEFTDEQDFGPYPAQFTVITIRILGGADRDELLGKLDAALQDVLARENIDLDEGSRREGNRALGQDQESVYFLYMASGQGGGLFSADRKIRILGEVFNDDQSSVTVLTLGLSQTTGPYSITGDEDTTQWSRIVGDPSGTIDGFKRADGLAYRVVSHG